ncbi:velvet factor-domain-containing protein [Suillus paluster]|uniref:velvet factor-domain-containing protein n=1 Tax=Suillus paluster TaxID=48578 RepID=UPI001B872BE1|nr:velvet factor-domain-containing protein [Suillus paluster]KAG1737549.1 velvet factor-domain-containing protein [Suillus paluster]
MMHESTRRTITSYINAPIHFISGQFQGRCVRAELVEIQKADLGRKYARVDRRPLDPPPVVQLKLFHIYNEGTDNEYEQEVQNYDDIQNLGLLCNVDLFQVHNRSNSLSEPASLVRLPHQLSPVVEPVRSSPYPLPSILPRMATDHLPPISGTGGVPASDAQLPQFHPYAHLDSLSLAENMKCTTALSGATFVQPACIEYQGKRALVFPFADLAVKAEGDFFLRYRIFDIFSRMTNLSDVPVQAECRGGPFHIYSTKEFPGLQPSTELSKQLSKYGVRLNTRETERKRKKKGFESSVTSSRRKGKGRATRNTRNGSECD